MERKEEEELAVLQSIANSEADAELRERKRMKEKEVEDILREDRNEAFDQVTNAYASWGYARTRATHSLSWHVLCDVTGMD